jgi:PAS domain S-box-containing protein
MTLLGKSALFASTVLAMQLAVVAGLLFVLTISEKKAEQLAYSRAAIYGSARISAAFTEALHMIAIFAAFRDQAVEKQYDQLFNEVSTTLSDLQNNKCASPEDLKELSALSVEAGYLLRRTKQFEENLQACQSPESFVLEGASFKATISPYLMRIAKSTKAFSQRHLAMEQTIERKNGPVLFAAILGLMFVINVLTTVVYVIGFNKTVLRRLAMITENFKLYASNRQLLPPQSGKDEIAQVDSEFHSLSRALKEAASKDKAIFENLPVGLLTCDETGRIQSTNPCARSMFGELATGMPLTELVDQSAQLELLFKSPTSGSLRTRVKSGFGRSILTELSVSGFLHKDTKHFIVAILDLSAREELENRRQEFVNIVSHDIRTPITSVCMLLDLLRGRETDTREQTVDYCDKAKAQLDTIMKLTSDLLDVARIESNTIKLQKQDCSVGAIIETSIEIVAMQAARSGVRIIEHPTDIFVECDPDRVQQVLVNFLSNALKYTPSGKRIEVSARRQDNNIIVSVKDQGPGIPEKSLGTIFERFSTEDGKAGTGLGLAICKLLAESHGGKVGVNTTLGVGSEFWLQLPAGENVDGESSISTNRMGSANQPV